MARPSELTPELTERLALLIRAGNTIDIAAQACGLHDSTFREWMGRSELEFVTFQDEIAKAQAEAEATQVARISKAAGHGSWQAAAWLLERRYGERWSKTAAMEPEPEPSADDFIERLKLVR